jgi:hypothetical protein
MTITADTAALSFMGFNAAFLLLTVVMFRRMSLPSKRHLFSSWTQETVLEDLQWQYSLRSNLLIAIVVLTLYLIYIQEVKFLLVCYSCLSLMNVTTDYFLYYDTPIYEVARTGHRVAGIITISVTIMWWSTKIEATDNK